MLGGCGSEARGERHLLSSAGASLSWTCSLIPRAPQSSMSVPSTPHQHARICPGQSHTAYPPPPTSLRHLHPHRPVNVPDCLPPLPTASTPTPTPTPTTPTPTVTASSGPGDTSAADGGSAAGDGAGGENFRSSNGPAPVPAPSDSPAPSDDLPSLDALVEQFPLDFRTSLPYKPIPGYGGEWPDWGERPPVGPCLQRPYV